MMNKTTITLALAMAIALGGCAKDDANAPVSKTEPGANNPTEAPTAATPETQFPPALMLAIEPEGAKNLAEVKATAKAGDQVVVRGRVGGTKHPFVENRATMVIADIEKMKSCAENPTDTCDTPWDYCCETPEDKTAYTATIKVYSENGNLVHSNLDSVPGIDPLTVVIVKGTVGERPDPSVLEINATGIYVVPK